MPEPALGSCSLSALTLAKRTAGSKTVAACWNAGAIILQGPHQSARKSTSSPISLFLRCCRRRPLKAGKLKIVLSGFENPPVPVHILHREGRHSSAKIRSFVDLMAERLRAELA